MRCRSRRRARATIVVRRARSRAARAFDAARREGQDVPRRRGGRRARVFEMERGSEVASGVACLQASGSVISLNSREIEENVFVVDVGVDVRFDGLVVEGHARGGDGDGVFETGGRVARGRLSDAAGPVLTDVKL